MQYTLKYDEKDKKNWSKSNARNVNGNVELVEKELRLYDITKFDLGRERCIKSVCENINNGNIVLGTGGGHMVELNLDSSKNEKHNSVIYQTPSEVVIEGLVSFKQVQHNPFNSLFVSIDKNGYVSRFNTKSGRLEKKGLLDNGCSILQLQHGESDTPIALAGFVNGYIQFIQLNEQTNKPTTRKCYSVQDMKIVNKVNSPITAAKFNQDNTICAVGCEDGTIVIYQSKVKGKW
jgi:hypothetical protein